MVPITEDYVSFETAKLLKEKGFDEDCNAYWDLTTETKTPKIGLSVSSKNWNYKWNPIPFPISAPTLQMAMKWLRKEYNIHIEPRYFPMPNIYRYVIIRSPATIENIDSHPQYFSSHEEACDAAIKYCLEILVK